jgi:hypothetical protein
MFGIRIGKSILKSIRVCVPGIILLAVFLAVVPADISAENASAVDRTITEYEVKAAYIYYFAKFVDWPSIAFPMKYAPIIVGVLGDEDFAALLERTVKDKMIQEHPMQVHRYQWPVDLRSCHILYISSSEQKRLRQITESLREQPVLTVTEAEENSQAKGIMNLFVEGGKVQFEVNITDAEKARLRISSKLLRLARGTVGSYSGKGE